MWFVDPDAKILEVFELREHRWVLLATLADDEPVSQPPFDAIAFPLDALWPESAAAGDASQGDTDENGSDTRRAGSGETPAGPDRE